MRQRHTTPFFFSSHLSFHGFDDQYARFVLFRFGVEGRERDPVLVRGVGQRRVDRGHALGQPMPDGYQLCRERVEEGYEDYKKGC